MKKVYESPKIKSEPIKIGVFGKYNVKDKDKNRHKPKKGFLNFLPGKGSFFKFG
jgi:hypothetical protein